MVKVTLRAEWRCVSIIHGEQSVRTSGTLLIAMYSVINWGSRNTVSAHLL